MKKLIASMIVSVIMGQPILAGPLSMTQWRLTGDSKSPERFQSATAKYIGAPAIYVGPPTMQKGRTKVWVMLGGALAFSLLSWQQFDRASDNEAEAALNRAHGQFSRAQKLDDKADRARLYGWSAAVLRRQQLRGGSDLAQNHPPRLSWTQFPRRQAARRRILRLFVLRA